MTPEYAEDEKCESSEDFIQLIARYKALRKLEEQALALIEYIDDVGSDIWY